MASIKILLLFAFIATSCLVNESQAEQKSEWAYLARFIWRFVTRFIHPPAAVPVPPIATPVPAPPGPLTIATSPTLAPLPSIPTIAPLPTAPTAPTPADIEEPVTPELPPVPVEDPVAPVVPPVPAVADDPSFKPNAVPVVAPAGIKGVSGPVDSPKLKAPLVDAVPEEEVEAPEAEEPAVEA